MAKPDAAEVLAVYLDEVKAGHRSVSECAAANPELRAELEPLLALAQRISPPCQIEIDQVRKVRARHRFVEALHQESQRRSPWWAIWRAAAPSARWRTVPAVAAIVVALSMAGGGAAFAAARTAQPDDPLYGLKTALEQVQVAAAFSDDQKASVFSYMAGQRLDETSRAMDAGKDDAAAGALRSYEAAAARAREHLARAQAEGKDVSQILGQLLAAERRQQEILLESQGRGKNRGRDQIDPNSGRVPHQSGPGDASQQSPGSSEPTPTAFPVQPPEQNQNRGTPRSNGAGQPGSQSPEKDRVGSPSGANSQLQENRVPTPSGANEQTQEKGRAVGSDRGR